MAWTAGVGRSHFDHRAAVVFGDSESLRERLRTLVEADERSRSGTPRKVAFVYSGHGSGWAGMAAALYASEPVARAVLDRCEEVFGEVRAASLLDVMFGRSGAAGDLSDPQWERPAVYAFECALTALWATVGVVPGVALGQGVGGLAAAQAAGALSLEDGLRQAAALDDPGALLEAVEMGTPSLTLVDAVSGRVVAPDEAPDMAQWLQHVATGPEALERCVPTLEAAGVDVVIDLAPDRDFLEAVAFAYEAGLALSFAGLFAGETRRRTALPDYPFERRRHWIATRERQAGSPS